MPLANAVDGVGVNITQEEGHGSYIVKGVGQDAAASDPERVTHVGTGNWNIMVI